MAHTYNSSIRETETGLPWTQGHQGHIAHQRQVCALSPVPALLIDRINLGWKFCGSVAVPITPLVFLPGYRSWPLQVPHPQCWVTATVTPIDSLASPWYLLKTKTKKQKNKKTQKLPVKTFDPKCILSTRNAGTGDRTETKGIVNQ